ncbi:hypothetical protein PSY31_22090, partial [Shigella flexneri]|nr:hypothetical protein [Shigella flexneri]
SYETKILATSMLQLRRQVVKEIKGVFATSAEKLLLALSSFSTVKRCLRFWLLAVEKLKKAQKSEAGFQWLLEWLLAVTIL